MRACEVELPDIAADGSGDDGWACGLRRLDNGPSVTMGSVRSEANGEAGWGNTWECKLPMRACEVELPGIAADGSGDDGWACGLRRLDNGPSVAMGSVMSEANG